MEFILSQDENNQLARQRLRGFIKKGNITEVTNGLNAIKGDNNWQILLDVGTSGHTILSYAIKQKTDNNIIEKILNIAKEGDILEKLLLLDVGTSGHTILSYAIKQKTDNNIIEKILNIAKEGDILEKLLEIENRQDNIVLYWAVQTQNIEIVKKILNITKETRNQDGSTALNKAVQLAIPIQNREITELLFNAAQKAGITINLIGPGGVPISLTNCSRITIADGEPNQDQVPNDQKIKQDCSATTLQPEMTQREPEMTQRGSELTFSNFSGININDESITFNRL